MPHDTPPLPEALLRHADFVRALAFAALRGDAESEDVAQDAWVAALAHAPEDPARQRPWFVRVVRNRAAELLRGRGRRVRRERVAAETRGDAPATDALAARAETGRRVVGAVLALAEPLRSAVLLRFLEGLPPREVARRLGVPVETARTRVRRGLERLRRTLAEHEPRAGGAWRPALLALLPDVGAGGRALDGLSPNVVGALTVKKALAAALVLLFLGGGAWWLRERAGGPPRPPAPPLVGERPAAGSSESTPAPTLVARVAEADSPPVAPVVPVAGPRITGRVVDAQQRAVGSARVIVLPEGNTECVSPEGAPGRAGPSHACRADAEGRFVVSVEAGAVTHQVLAWAEGHAPALLVDVAPGAEVRLTLGVGVVLRGMVRDLDGRPVAGARVRALQLVDALRWEREGRSASEGAYEVSGLAEWRPADAGWRGLLVRAWFLVEADGFAPLLVDARGLGGGPSPTCEQDFLLQRGAELVGRVEDAETGLALAGAQVALHSVEGQGGFARLPGVVLSNPWAPRPLQQVTADAQGRFRFLGVPAAGPHPSATGPRSPRGPGALGGLVAFAPGYAAATARVDLPEDGDVVEFVLQAWPAATVVGRLVESDGTPARSASVAIDVEGREREGHVPEFVQGAHPAYVRSVGPDGRFRVEGAPARRGALSAARLRVTRRGPESNHVTREGSDAERTLELRAGEVLDVGDVVLRPALVHRRTWVTVRDARGQAVAGARISRGGIGSDLARTDLEGRAALTWWTQPGRPPADGAERFVVQARGFSPAPLTLTPPAAGEGAAQVVLRDGHRVAGRALTSDGLPLAGVRLTVADGSLPLEAVFPAGAVPGGLVYSSAELPPGRSLPVEYASVATDEEGRFDVQGLPEGPYHLRAQRPRRVPNASAASLQVLVADVRAGAEGLELRLPDDDSPATGAIEGQVRERGTRRPVAGLQVVLRRGAQVLAVAEAPRPGSVAPWRSPDAARLEADGRFRFPAVPVGRCEVFVSAGGRAPAAPVEVEVRAGETIQLPDLELERGVTLLGRVVLPSGLSAERFDLRLVSLAAGAPSAPTSVRLAPDGTFRCVGVTPGRYQVRGAEDMFRPPLTGQRHLTLLPEGDAVLLVAPASAGGNVQRYDAVLLSGATLLLAPSDPRLPDEGWRREGAPGPAAPARALGAAARVVVRRGDGGWRTEYSSVSRDMGALTVLPGAYVAELHLPGEPVREQAFEVEAGAEVRVTFPRP